MRLATSIKYSVIAHMNAEHADALALYARHFAAIEDVRWARMVDIDLHGLELEVLGAELSRIRIDFEQPLTGAETIRPHLVAMAREARAHLEVSP